MVKAHFEDIKQVLLDEVGKADKSLDIAMAWFSDKELFELICSKLDNGLIARIEIRNDYTNNHYKALDWQVFIDKGGILYFDREGILHDKYCIIDSTLIITGSYNWTYNASENNIENVILTDDPKTVEQYICDFEELIHSDEPIIINERVSGDNLESYQKQFLDEEIETEQYLEHMPDEDSQDISPEVLLYEALLCYRKKQYDEAEQILVHSALASSAKEANGLLGSIRLAQGQYDEAINLSKKGLDLGDEEDADIYNTMGLAYHEKEKYSEAIKSFDKSIGLQPLATTWYSNKLNSLWSLGHHKDADKLATDFKSMATNFIRTNKGICNRNVLKAQIEIGGLCLQINSIDDAIKHGQKAQLIYDGLDESEQDLHDLDLIKELTSFGEKKSNN